MCHDIATLPITFIMKPRLLLANLSSFRQSHQASHRVYVLEDSFQTKRGEAVNICLSCLTSTIFCMPIDDNLRPESPLPNQHPKTWNALAVRSTVTAILCMMSVRGSLYSWLLTKNMASGFLGIEFEKFVDFDLIKHNLQRSKISQSLHRSLQAEGMTNAN